MKCRNCGYSNPSDKSTCIKCNTRLHSKDEDLEQKISANVENRDSISRTIIGEQPKEPYVDRAIRHNEHEAFNAAPPSEASCHQCGYLLMKSSTFCPNCNAPASPPVVINNAVNRVNRNEKPLAGTIDPFRKQGFSLRPIINGIPSSNVLEFHDNNVSLNRNNTLQENMTITSKIQAEITNKDGTWVITDKSESKTTFVQAAEPREIRKGDIIVMGDTKFIFE